METEGLGSPREVGTSPDFEKGESDQGGDFPMETSQILEKEEAVSSNVVAVTEYSSSTHTKDESENRDNLFILKEDGGGRESEDNLERFLDTHLLNVVIPNYDEGAVDSTIRNLSHLVGQRVGESLDWEILKHFF